MTLPLLVNQSGRKLGKSEGNAVWIEFDDQQMNRLYQYLFNLPDSQVINMVKMLTFASESDIKEVYLF